MCCYPNVTRHINPANVKESCICICIHTLQVPVNMYLIESNVKNILKTFYTEVNKNKSGYFANVNSLVWVFPNKCLPSELTIGGKLCKPIRRVIPAERVGWHSINQLYINNQCCSHLVSALRSSNHNPKGKHSACCLACKTQTVQTRIDSAEQSYLLEAAI